MGCVWQHLLFCPLDPFICLAVPTPGVCSQLRLTPGGGQLSHSISFSRAAAMAITFWWAPPTFTRLLSTEDSLLPLSGVWCPGGWTSFGWGLAAVSGALLCFHPWQSSKEDTTSSISSGSPGGDPGSLCCLYTLRYKDFISFLLVWGLPAGQQISLPQGPALATPVSFHPWSTA